MIFLETSPPYLRVWMTPPPPSPPYLKVWICHWDECLTLLETVHVYIICINSQKE